MKYVRQFENPSSIQSALQNRTLEEPYLGYLGSIDTPVTSSNQLVWNKYSGSFDAGQANSELGTLNLNGGTANNIDIDRKFCGGIADVFTIDTDIKNNLWDVIKKLTIE